jgi:hypothetical protein
MSIGMVLPGSGDSQIISLLAQIQQARVNINQLAQSLNGRDLPGAQKAYGTLKANPNGGLGGFNLLQKEFDAVGQALDAGDLPRAQQAFAELSQAAGALQGAAPGRVGGSGSAAVKTVVSEAITTSASGQITTVITDSDSSSSTTTTYGPPPSSSRSVTA